MANRRGNTIYNNFDRFTGEPFNTTVVTQWIDGTAMNDSKVDNVIYFKNTASLGGGYSKRDFTGALNPRWFGINADGTDEAVKIQSMLNFGGYFPIQLEDKTYKSNSALTVNSNIKIYGKGINSSRLDLSGILDLTSIALKIDGSNSIVNLGLINEVVAYGATSIKINTPVTLKRGDTLMINNPADFSFSPFKDSYREGEFVRVNDDVTNGTTIPISGSLQASYTLTCIIYKVVPVNSIIRDLSILGHISTGATLQFKFCIADVTNVKASGSHYSAIDMVNVLNSNISNCAVDNDEPDINGTSYGLTIINSQNVNISGINGSSNRHVITTGSSSAYSLPNRGISVTHCNLSAKGLVAPLDFHGNAQNCFVSDCVLRGGIDIAGDNISVVNNDIYQLIASGSNGTAIYFSELKTNNHTIAGNRIYATKYTGNGVWIEALVRQETTNLGYTCIKDNQFFWETQYGDVQDINGIRFYTGGSNNANNYKLDISGNVFNNSDATKYVTAIRVERTSGSNYSYVKITENTFDRCDSILNYCDNLVYQNNTQIRPYYWCAKFINCTNVWTNDNSILLSNSNANGTSVDNAAFYFIAVVSIWNSGNRGFGNGSNMQYNQSFVNVTNLNLGQNYITGAINPTNLYTNVTNINPFKGTVLVGRGTPEGVLKSPTGSIFIREDGVEGTTLYQKVVGGGLNTGWKPVQTIISGTTALRPTVTVTGYEYFDTTLSRLIVWNGSSWNAGFDVDTGTTSAPSLATLNTIPVTTIAIGNTRFYTNNAVLMAYTRISATEWLQTPIQKVV